MKHKRRPILILIVVLTHLLSSLTVSAQSSEDLTLNQGEIQSSSSVDKIPAPFSHAGPRAELPPTLASFIQDKVIPTEAIYFEPGTGIDPETAMPYDHVRIHLQKGLLGEVGNYTAASKLSLVIPYLLGVIKQKPVFRKVGLTPEKAEKLLTKELETLLIYIKKYPDYGGFLPWVDLRSNGTIAPATAKMPSLDNGQLVWALAAVIASFEDSDSPQESKMAQMAQTIVNTQNFNKFYNPEKGLLHGTIQRDAETGQWIGDETYYLNDMFEGVLAVLWGVLHGQIPESAWYNLAIPTVDYAMQSGEKVTTFQGFRASFHENWALGFLPLMESPLAPLYENYLYVQADFANRHKLPGFLSTAYDAQGTYRQMGIPPIAYQRVDRSNVAVVFATAMGMLISSFAGAVWLKNIYEFQNVLTAYGAVESVGTDGYADIFTADGKGMTLLAVSGGVVEEIKKYLEARTVPKTGIPMRAKLMELLYAKYIQMLQARNNEPIYVSTQPYPVPPQETIEVHPQLPPEAGNDFDLISHLQKGHLHGKNVRSVGCKTLEDDILPGKPLGFEFEIPAYYPYFDQWAFRGTYIDKVVRIDQMRYLTLSIPAVTPPALFEIELKSDDITLANAVIDTTLPGVLSNDGQWKTIALRLNPIPEADYKGLNYVAVAIHDPSYLIGRFTFYGRSGIVRIKDLHLLRDLPSKDLVLLEQARERKEEGVELTRYWRLSHGNLPFQKDDLQGIYHFQGGLGWRGGYLPYTDLNEYKYLYLKIRNVMASCNCVTVELKHESEQLGGYKIPISIPQDNQWHLFQIEIPKKMRRALNYFAVSDPLGDFELASIRLTNDSLSGTTGETIYFISDQRRFTRCIYHCASA